jgi:phosphoribosylamine---glycine ligase
MRVLVVGSGAREHALCWALRRSTRLGELFCAPGNGGTSALAENVTLDPMDGAACATWAEQHNVDLTVIGPEDPLAAGIADTFVARGLSVFGPSAAAARIESSKGWAKELMERVGVPTAHAGRFTDRAAARTYLNRLEKSGIGYPVVVKADGLAAGKGVVVAADAAEANAALDAFMVSGELGAAGRSVLIEEFLRGTELSLFAMTDGRTVVPLAPACDYKRALDGDKGPNTGGMGAYSPPAFATATLLARIDREILQPAVRALAEAGCPFQGLLYAGLMVTAEGPKVVEFNCRFGDPETQVVLPRLNTDLLELLHAVAQGRLGSIEPPVWREEVCLGVVAASGGYPGHYEKGLPILGLDSLDADVLVFHAGTQRDGEGRLVTAGGRVLTVAALGATLAEARERVYANLPRARFDGIHWRTDIAAREVP